MAASGGGPEAPHRPVLLFESVELLDPARGGLFVDATLGLGGHSEAILMASNETREPFGGATQRLSVAVNADDARFRRGFEDRFAVPAKTERRVHEEAPALRGEEACGFNEQHGAMGRARPPSGLRHYHRPVVLKSSSELRAKSDGVTSIGSSVPALALSLNAFTLCHFSDS